MEIRKIFAEFNGGKNESLSALCRMLLKEQRESWPALTAACRELADVRTKSIHCGPYDVMIQHNPRRQVSSGAAVDRESIKSRPCFLCEANRPAEQKGILYRNDYLILCNPAPIFDQHFTVVHKQHIPQSITACLSDFIQLARDLVPGLTIFYNGPACGASAPDHLHFQIIPTEQLPMLKDTANQFGLIRETDGVNIYEGKNTDRAIILLEAESVRQLENAFRRIMQSLQKRRAEGEEGMINVICNYVSGKWRVFIFLREKHRPAAFFAEGEKRVFVSLGAIDMAGVIITPLQQDFENLDAAAIRGIYKEVSQPPDFVKKIIDEI